MSRNIPKCKEWRVTRMGGLWEAESIVVTAPNAYLAKLNAAHEWNIPLLWIGGFKASVVRRRVAK